MTDTLLSYYTGKKVDKGAKLIIGQHGGIYGTSLYSWFEKHEVKISDKYLNWGWNDQKLKRKIIKAGILVELENMKSGLLYESYDKLYDEDHVFSVTICISSPEA